MPLKFIRQFIQIESASGILLFLTTLLGLIIYNSSARPFYNALFSTPIPIQISALKFSAPFILWINDGLMVLFFFLIGLEIKREILAGELNSTRKIVLPGIAAIAGMIMPAAIYLTLNIHHPSLLRGWAIPTATDIAFALGIIRLLGTRIPLSLKVFLTALAIFDDLGAVIIIAVFYTEKLVWSYISASLLTFILLCIINYKGIRRLSIYLSLGVLLWFILLHSGIHATIAGVLVAITIPLDKTLPEKDSLLRLVETQLHPWVSFLILPLFAFANMKIPCFELDKSHLISSLPLGIALGLLLGKQLGVFSAIWLTVKLRWGILPTDANWRMVYGVSLLCGIGFTMSFFIGGLAFEDYQNNIELVRTGVVAGSLLSGMLGYLVLRYGTKGK